MRAQKTSTADPKAHTGDMAMSNRLTVLAAEISRAHQAAREAAQTSLDRAIEAGEALSDKPEPACEGCKSEAFRPPTDTTRPLRQRGPP